MKTLALFLAFFASLGMLGAAQMPPFKMTKEETAKLKGLKLDFHGKDFYTGTHLNFDFDSGNLPTILGIQYADKDQDGELRHKKAALFLELHDKGAKVDPTVVLKTAGLSTFKPEKVKISFLPDDEFHAKIADVICYGKNDKKRIEEFFDARTGKMILDAAFSEDQVPLIYDLNVSQFLETNEAHHATFCVKNGSRRIFYQGLPKKLYDYVSTASALASPAGALEFSRSLGAWFSETFCESEKK